MWAETEASYESLMMIHVVDEDFLEPSKLSLMAPMEGEEINDQEWWKEARLGSSRSDSEERCTLS